MEEQLKQLQIENEKLKNELAEKNKIIELKNKDEILKLTLEQLKQAQSLKEKYEGLLIKLKEQDRNYEKLYASQKKMFKDLQEELGKLKELKVKKKNKK